MGDCALEKGKISTCCWVEANQTSLSVTGVDPKKGYIVSVSASNEVGEGEKSSVVIKARELLWCHIIQE